MIAVLALYGLLIIMFGVFVRRVVRHTAHRPDTCLHCGYSLEGLGTDTVCPECGTSTPRVWPDDKPHLAVILGRLGGMLMIATVPCALLEILAVVAHRWSYKLQAPGFRPDVIRRAIEVRPNDFFWETAWVPLVLAGVWCVMLLWRSSASKFWSDVVRTALVGWAGSTVWLFVQTWITYH